MLLISRKLLEQARRPGTLRTATIVAAVSILLKNFPGLDLLFVPFKTFDAFIHEGGHALVCLLTGGTVNWMKLGMGGITDCYGGNQTAIALAGYISQAVVGSIMIALTRYKAACRWLLILIGTAIGIADLLIIHDRYTATWAFLVGLLFTVIGYKGSTHLAHLTVLLLATETVVNVSSDMQLVVLQSIGLLPDIAVSDATHLAALTGCPAFAWSILWCTISLIGLTLSIWSHSWNRNSAPHTVPTAPQQT